MSGGRVHGGRVVGVGLRPGTDPGRLLAAAGVVLDGLAARDVAAVATLDRRAADPAVLALAAHLGAVVVGLDAAELAARSGAGGPRAGRVAAAVGTPAVAEPAALLVAARGGGVPRLVVGRRVLGGVVLAVADPG